MQYAERHYQVTVTVKVIYPLNWQNRKSEPSQRKRTMIIHSNSQGKGISVRCLRKAD